MAWSTEARTETDADPARVWELWDDPSRWADWNDEISSGSLEGPCRVGSVALIKPKGFPALRFQFVAIEPGRLLTSEARMPGTRLRHDHIVERQGQKTVIRNRMTLVGPASRVWAVLYGWRLRRSVRGFVQRERALAEDA
jgi:Polyketide cyclase / dehydrase and lipid transport